MRTEVPANFLVGRKRRLIVQWNVRVVYIYIYIGSIFHLLVLFFEILQLIRDITNNEEMAYWITDSDSFKMEEPESELELHFGTIWNPCQRDKGKYSALGTHYAARGLHYLPKGLQYCQRANKTHYTALGPCNGALIYKIHRPPFTK